MIILKPISTPQDVEVFIRKQSTAYVAVLTQEDTADEISIPITGIYKDGKLSFELSHNFIDKRFYWLLINDGFTGQNLNKSKIFVTSQDDLEKYSMTDDYYTIIQKDEKRYIIRE